MNCCVEGKMYEMENRKREFVAELKDEREERCRKKKFPERR